MDTKNQELIRSYKNNGAEWRPVGSPERVKVIAKEPGQGQSLRVYDLTANVGWVSVGTDHDTAAFAVNTIRSWWNTTGHTAYRSAPRLLITVHGGGSND